MKATKEKISANAAALRCGALGIVLLLSACVTHPPLAATLPEEAAVSAPPLSSYAAMDGFVPVGMTKMRLLGNPYPGGFEQLRVVRRDHTGRAVASQVAGVGRFSPRAVLRVLGVGCVFSRYHRKMQTNLIPGKTLRNNDAAILDGLNENARDGGGNTMVIGIRNEAGDIYRVVRTVGLGEFFAIVGVLTDRIGLGPVNTIEVRRR